LTHSREARLGVVYGLLAYAWWGFVALYFKAVANVPALEVLAHRVVWSALLLLVFVAIRGRGRDLRGIARDRRALLTLAGTAALIATNWYVFIWAVAHGHLLQASFGYYINPLVNVLLGVVFLGERLRTPQRWSVALAVVGVAWLGVSYRQVPLVALTLATSFGLYGLLRKTARADALTGLTLETILLLPLALAFLLGEHAAGRLVFLHGDRATDLLLPTAGVVTALPLLWFANAARRLRLATLGFLQYLSPSLQFLLAVALFGEAFTPAHRVAFACIWTALALYTVDTLRTGNASAQGHHRDPTHGEHAG